MPETNGAALRIEGIRKTYGDFVAVDDIGLDIRAGEFMAFLGPSGSGKTTLLNIIAGFVGADAGQIVLDDREIAGLPPHRRGIGMVFQHYALFPHMSVFDNVAFPLRRRGVPRQDLKRRVAEALDMVRLGNLGTRKPSELSGGQQQRVALARAIVFRPRLLLMDEPLGALDKALRAHLQLELRRIHQELGITFVYVTHDQEEALVLADRIAVFNEGHLEQIATAEQLYSEPATRFAAEFIGESSLVPGVVASIEDGIAVVAGAHGSPEFAARAAPSLCVGDDAVIVVRPEQFILQRDEAVPNAVRAVVRESIYLGSVRRVHLEGPNDIEIVVALPADRARLDPGSEVVVGWQTQHAIAVPDGSVPFSIEPGVATATLAIPAPARRRTG